MKKIVKKPTVTLALSAYNEEKNIKNFLQSVLMQKEESFKLEKIVIISDGSTDKTTSIVQSFKSSKIELIDSKKRIGKSSRLNDIYENLTSDILVQSDCDVIFAHPYVIRDIIKPLIKNNNVGMCGGNPLPMKATTFTEQAVNYTVNAYLQFRKEVKHGNNLFSADGRLLAYKKELIKKIHIPEDMICNDQYTYFCCLVNNFKYRFVETANVYFRSPQTLKDHIKQNTRFLSSEPRMKRHFPAALVKKEFEIPTILRVRHLLSQFIKNPIFCIYIFLVNRYCFIKSRIVEKNLTATWAMAHSTKQLKTVK